MKKWYLSLLSCVGLSFASAQTVFLAEHFDYPADSLLQRNGWYAHSAGTTNPIKVTNGGLSWKKTAYKGSGIGNAAAVNNTGSDENRPFNADATTGNLYVSFLMTVNEMALASPGMFFHLGQYGNPSTPVYTNVSSSFRARTHLIAGSDSSKFKLGLSFNNSNPDDTTDQEFNVGQTYLVVVKHIFVSGTLNDSVALYVFADGDDISSEPSVAAIGPLAGTQADLTSIQTVALRQYNAAQDITVDGIIAQDAWDLLAKRVVKFSVDMKNVTPSANGVHVAGNFQGWSPDGTKLTQEGTSSIYSTTVEVESNFLTEYKFVNDNGWNGVESVPAISQKGHANNGESNDNRWFFSGMGSDTIILPAYVFGNAAPDGQYAVRLAVDLQKEKEVDSDGVHVAGNIQKAAGYPEWNPSATAMTNLFNNNKIYEAILCVPNGDYAYKFVNGNSWGKDESVPSSCATDNNRAISVNNSNVEAKKVCFGSCDACPEREIPKYNVTFQIDMKKECNFEKVDIAGGRINNWNGGDFLTDDDKDGIYTITVKLDSGVEVAHKVRKIDAAGNVNWEGGADRKIFVHGDSTFAVRCFGLDEPCSGSVIAPANILFQVDMTKEIPQDTVWVMGSFTSPAWQDGALPLLPNKDNQDIYEALVENVCNEYFEYKFVNAVMSSSENGETFPDTMDRACLKDNGIGGFNRHYTRTSTDEVTLGYVYNSCATIQLNQVKNIHQDVRIAPNPASGSFEVFMNSAAITQVSVMSLDGRILRNLQTQSNRVQVEVSGLSGVYLVQVRDIHGNVASHKIILQ